MNHVHQRSLSFNATVEEVAKLNEAALDLHDTQPRTIELGEITLRNVIVIDVQAGARSNYDAATGHPAMIHTTVRYHALQG